MKNFYKKISVLALSICSLSACFAKTSSKMEQKEEKEEHAPIAVKETTYKKDTSTTVLIDDNNINPNDIVKIIKHGDHWHVFTRDGKEHITYTDPSKMKNINGLELVKVVTLNQLRGMNIKCIKVHGNHWHVFTRSGQEYLTYENPSVLFPNIVIEQYHGGDHHVSSNSVSHGTATIDNQNRVYKILQHGDHYHIYTTDGGEFIVYQDPRPYYPNASFGQYEGNHHVRPLVSGNQIVNPQVPNNVLPTPSVPNPVLPNPHLGPIVSIKKLADLKGHNISKIIDHGDHWHVYENGKEIAIVRENPRAMFPNAEYIKEDRPGGEGVIVNDNEVFTYDDVEEKLDKRVEKVLSNNLKAMTSYGVVKDDLPVFGIVKQDENGKYFYWLHESHYHAVSIKDIIAMAKEGKFKDITARQVVAFLKYKVNHNYKIEDRIDSEEEQLAKIKFLAKYYGLKERDVVYFLGKYEVRIDDEAVVSIAAEDLSVENGVVKAEIKLPKIEKKPIIKNDDQKDHEIEKTDQDK